MKEQSAGRTERKRVARSANGFAIVQASEVKLFWREFDGRLAV